MANTILPESASVNGLQPQNNNPMQVFVSNSDDYPIAVEATLDTTGLATSAKQDTQITAEQAIQATLGAITGAAIVTDVDGTVQRYLRGLIKLFITVGSALVTATGNVADDAVDSGNPIKVGASAQNPDSLPTAASANDRVNLVTDLSRRLIVYLGTKLDSTNDSVTAVPLQTTTLPVQITKTIAATGTPEVLAADNTFFITATLIGKKAARTNNTGIVYLGIGVTNDAQAYEIAPGGILTLNAPVGQRYDLNDWGLDVLNNGDGVIVIYS